jgi:hypothetical protein
MCENLPSFVVTNHLRSLCLISNDSYLGEFDA